MQNSSLPLLQFRSKDLPNLASPHDSPISGAEGFFDLHPVGAVARGLFLSLLLWVLLAFVVYTVYTMIVGAH